MLKEAWRTHSRVQSPLRIGAFALEIPPGITLSRAKVPPAKTCREGSGDENG